MAVLMRRPGLPRSPPQPSPSVSNAAQRAGLRCWRRDTARRGEPTQDSSLPPRAKAFCRAIGDAGTNEWPGPWWLVLPRTRDRITSSSRTACATSRPLQHARPSPAIPSAGASESAASVMPIAPTDRRRIVVPLNPSGRLRRRSWKSIQPPLCPDRRIGVEPRLRIDAEHDHRLSLAVASRSHRSIDAPTPAFAPERGEVVRVTTHATILQSRLDRQFHVRVKQWAYRESVVVRTTDVE